MGSPTRRARLRGERSWRRAAPSERFYLQSEKENTSIGISNTFSNYFNRVNFYIRYIFLWITQSWWGNLVTVSEYSVHVVILKYSVVTDSLDLLHICSEYLLTVTYALLYVKVTGVYTCIYCILISFSYRYIMWYARKYVHRKSNIELIYLKQIFEYIALSLIHI